MRSKPRGPDEITLRRRGRLPVWVQLGWRAALVLGLLAFAILVHWLERDGLKDNLDEHVSFLDVVYFTMISITTTGYGDIVPVANHTRMFDALVVTPIRIFFVLIFIGTAYTFVLRHTWDRWRMERLQKTLNNHVVVAGFGTSGSEAVDELIALGTKPEDIVVIDADEEALERAKSLGCAVAEADASRDKTLQAVRIQQARALIVSAGRDDTSILITMSARHLAPKLNISVAVRNEDNELLARQAGATTVINPVSFTGLLLATSSRGEHVADYLHDLVTTEGHVMLREREARPEEVGKSLQQACDGQAVRLYRGGVVHAPWDPTTRIKAGDMILEVVPTT
jgi:voltage-gated potassium channel